MKKISFFSKKIAKKFFYSKNSFYLCTAKEKKIRGMAQLASAPALGAGGRRFESCYPDSINENSPSQKGEFLFFAKIFVRLREI